MPSRAAEIPREDQALCATCGYVLDGLPPTAACPECGAPILASTGDDPRQLPAWERRGPFLPRFARTTAAVLLSPTAFFRTLTTRADPRGSRGFALLHHWLAAYLFAAAITSHFLLFFNRAPDASLAALILLGGASILTPFVFAGILGVRLLAGRLSAWEARYHGMRLPLVAVTRALHYHAAQLLPVALVTAAITLIYPRLMAHGLLPAASETVYLYALSAWIIAAAIYLFMTYWRAMKAIMWANR